jgi:hypothetical protein
MVCSREHDRACRWFEGSFDRWLGLVDQPASERGWGFAGGATTSHASHFYAALFCIFWNVVIAILAAS